MFCQLEKSEDLVWSALIVDTVILHRFAKNIYRLIAIINSKYLKYSFWKKLHPEEAEEKINTREIRLGLNKSLHSRDH